MDHKDQCKLVLSNPAWKHIEAYLQEIYDMNEEALLYSYRSGKNLEFDGSEKIRGRMEVLKELLNLPAAMKEYTDLTKETKEEGA